MDETYKPKKINIFGKTIEKGNEILERYVLHNLVQDDDIEKTRKEINCFSIYLKNGDLYSVKHAGDSSRGHKCDKVIIDIDVEENIIFSVILPLLTCSKETDKITFINTKNMEDTTMNIKYYNKEMPRINKFDKGDWIDLRADNISVCFNDEALIDYALKYKETRTWVNDFIEYSAGDIVIIRLGVAMQLPKGYEAELKPRSSTFKNYGLFQVNSVGCIDESYCGDNDEWIAIMYATRHGKIKRFDRLVQFRITEKMNKFIINEVESLGNEDRTGFGSTGK